MQKPLIGITCGMNEQGRYVLSKEYAAAVRAAGGEAVILPSDCKNFFPEVSGFLFSGGDDVDPLLWGEARLPQLKRLEPERDRYEIFLARRAWQENVPVLGICRGMQILNVALGGTLWQDIASQLPDALPHSPDIPLEKTAHRVFFPEEVYVNSHHHQGIRTLAETLSVKALAPDGLIEAFYAQSKKFFWGVQWHPERLLNADKVGIWLFQCFIQAGYRNFMAK